MPDLIDLQDTITEQIGVAAFTALKHHDEQRLEDAVAMINEWTNSDGECLLTHFFDETLESVEEYVLYTALDVENSQLEYGDYSFQPLD